MELAAHGVGLARAGLTVGEASRHSAFEDVLNQRPSRVPEAIKSSGPIPIAFAADRYQTSTELKGKH